MQTSFHPSVLVLIAHFKWIHIPYLQELAQHTDLHVAWLHEVHPGSVSHARKLGLDMHEIGVKAPDKQAQPPDMRQIARLLNAHPFSRNAWRRAARLTLARIKFGISAFRLPSQSAPDTTESRLSRLIQEKSPEIVHVMYYFHDELTVTARRAAGSDIILIYECRDPTTTLTASKPGSSRWMLEAEALAAADAYIFVSNALMEYLEHAHGVKLFERALIVPHAFPQRSLGAVSKKLSDGDGKLHIALVGTADTEPDHGRWYADIIRRLVASGLVVHSHFYEYHGRSLDVYRELAEALPSYYFHPVISYSAGEEYSHTLSSYDLMGVFHELEATHHNESLTLAVCMPTKAVSGWAHGCIPVVTYSRYRGLAEIIERDETGFLIDSLEDMREVCGDRERLARVTANCLPLRERYTHEYQVPRVIDFYKRCLPRGIDSLPSTPPADRGIREAAGG